MNIWPHPRTSFAYKSPHVLHYKLHVQCHLVVRKDVTTASVVSTRVAHRFRCIGSQDGIEFTKIKFRRESERPVGLHNHPVRLRGLAVARIVFLVDMALGAQEDSFAEVTRERVAIRYSGRAKASAARVADIPSCRELVVKRPSAAAGSRHRIGDGCGLCAYTAHALMTGVYALGCARARACMNDAALEAARATARAAWPVPWFLAGAYATACARMWSAGPPAWARNSLALRWATTAWNAAMAVLSVWMAVRIGEMVIPSIAEHGLAEEACDSRIERTWPMLVFVASKLVELGDTAWLVVRGRRLSALHVWHHASVMVYCWSAWGISAPAGSMFAFMNSIVHSVMYPYFCLMSVPVGAARGAKAVARHFSGAITLLQITQMATGLGLALLTVHCTPPEAALNNVGAIGMYASYVVLFIKLYLDRTLPPVPAARDE